MSILTDIIHKIFPDDHPAFSQASATKVQSNTQQQAQQSDISSTKSSIHVIPSIVMGELDIEAILDRKAQETNQPLNWRRSIVDLLQLLELDNSFESRKDLAHELHYVGDIEDSPHFNDWLLHHLMSKLSINGGKVPEDLRN